MPVVTGSVKLSMLGVSLPIESLTSSANHVEQGTIAVVIYSTTNNIVIYLVYMLFFYTAGMMTQMTKHLISQVEEVHHTCLPNLRNTI